MALLADDGEKFGGWPGTREWVYEKGWFDRFGAEIRTLVEEGTIVLSTLEDVRRAVPCGGLAYLPTASYREMEGGPSRLIRNCDSAPSSTNSVPSASRVPRGRSSADHTGATSW